MFVADIRLSGRTGCYIWRIQSTGMLWFIQ